MKLKKTILSVVACVLAFAMTFALTACGGDKDPVMTAISLDKTEATIATGETSRLAVEALYNDESKQAVAAGDVTWSSSAETVATVTRGVVSAKAKGTATITATYSGFTATCAVTVYALTVELNKATATVEKGTTEQLTATVKKDGVADSTQTVEWSSDNDGVASVDENGLVTAWSEGSATITAKRKGGAQTATCAVTVGWNNKPASYAEFKNTEQNKAVPNTWGFWNDQGWNWTTSKVYEAYTEDYETGKTAAEGYEYIGVQKATIQFEMDQPGVRDAAIQLIYRSAGEDGKLEINHNYEISLKLYSNVAGKVTLNAWDDVRSQGKDESDEDYEAFLEELNLPEHEFDIVAGENTLKVQFRHGDWGTIYPEGNYSNVESAIHLLLGNLEGRVQVSVYDVQYKDMGETTNKTDEPNFNAPVELPEITAPAIALPMDTANPTINHTSATEAEYGTYAITDNGEGKSYTIDYKTYTSTYENIAIDLANTNVSECNTFAVTIKNNGEADIQIRFDIKGTQKDGDTEDCVTSAVATEGTPEHNAQYGGTALTVAAGKTVTLYLTYDANGKCGAPTALYVYCNTAWYGTAESGWQEIKEARSGNVTISDFKFDTVTLPKSATADPVKLERSEDGSKMFFVVTGKCTSYTLDELKAAHGIYLQSGDMDASKDVRPADGEVSVTLNEDGTYEIRWDITNLAAGYYLGHLSSEFLGTDYGDIFHESDMDAITCNGKTYDYVQYQFDGGAWSRYCLTVANV